MIDSAVLYGTEYRFDTKTLRQELEKELDRILMSQVFEREHIENALLLEVADAKAEKARRKAEAESRRLDAARKEVLQQMHDEENSRVKAVAGELQAMNATADGLLSEDERARNEGI